MAKKKQTPAVSKSKRPGIATAKSTVLPVPPAPVAAPTSERAPLNLPVVAPAPTPAAEGQDGLARIRQLVSQYTEKALVFEVPDVNPYDEEGLSKVKLPKEPGVKFEELDPAMPLVELVTDLPYLVAERQSIDSLITYLEGEKKRLSESIFANLTATQLDKVLVGYFQATRVVPTKAREEFSLDEFKQAILSGLGGLFFDMHEKLGLQWAQYFETNFAPSAIIEAAEKKATKELPPQAAYLKVSDLRG